MQGKRIKVPIAFPYPIPPSRSCLNKLKRLPEATCDMKCPLGGHPPEMLRAGGRGASRFAGSCRALATLPGALHLTPPYASDIFFLSFFFEKI